jgi:hypothetical protein
MGGSALAWAAVWSVGGVLFGGCAEEMPDASWLLGVPLYLPALMVIWGMVRGATQGRAAAPLVGLCVGGATGLAATFFFVWGGGALTDGLAFRELPDWVTCRVIYGVIGAIVGAIAGGLDGLATGAMIKTGH